MSYVLTMVLMNNTQTPRILRNVTNRAMETNKCIIISLIRCHFPGFLISEDYMQQASTCCHRRYWFYRQNTWSVDVSPAGLAKFRSCEMWVYNCPISLKFDKHVGSPDACPKFPINFQSDKTISKQSRGFQPRRDFTIRGLIAKCTDSETLLCSEIL